MDSEVPLKIKVCLIGDTNVGKSSIVHRLNNDTLCGVDKYPTIGASFLSLKIHIQDRLLNFHLWDTAGQERFNSLVPMYFKDTQIYMIIFDLTDIDSFENLERVWIPMIKKYELPEHKSGTILVGNKKDQSQQVSDEKIDALCNKYGLKYIKISALTQSKKDIIEECMIKSFDVYAENNPLVFEKYDCLTNSDNVVHLSHKSKKNKCSNKVECAN